MRFGFVQLHLLRTSEYKEFGSNFYLILRTGSISSLLVTFVERVLERSGFFGVILQVLRAFMAYQVSMLSCTIALLYGTSARRTTDKVSVAPIKEAAAW